MRRRPTACPPAWQEWGLWVANARRTKTATGRRKQAPARPPAHGLPHAVPLLATLGLAVLCLCTLPAVRKQQRLEREHARLEQRTHEVVAEVERLRRELRDGEQQGYLRVKATRALLHGGADYIRARDARLRGGRPQQKAVSRSGRRDK